jgi:hypothetical protein
LNHVAHSLKSVLPSRTISGHYAGRRLLLIRIGGGFAGVGNFLHLIQVVLQSGQGFGRELSPPPGCCILASHIFALNENQARRAVANKNACTPRGSGRGDWLKVFPLLQRGARNFKDARKQDLEVMNGCRNENKKE